MSKRNEMRSRRDLGKRLTACLSRMFPKVEGEGSCRDIQPWFWKQLITQKRQITVRSDPLVFLSILPRRLC